MLIYYTATNCSLAQYMRKKVSEIGNGSVVLFEQTGEYFFTIAGLK